MLDKTIPYYNVLMITMVLNHIGTQTMETERLVLRRFELADTQSVFENWMSDPKVQNNYGETECKTIAETRKIIEKWISSYNNNEFYRWGIILKQGTGFS